MRTLVGHKISEAGPLGDCQPIQAIVESLGIPNELRGVTGN